MGRTIFNKEKNGTARRPSLPKKSPGDDQQYPEHPEEKPLAATLLALADFRAFPLNTPSNALAWPYSCAFPNRPRQPPFCNGELYATTALRSKVQEVFRHP